MVKHPCTLAVMYGTFDSQNACPYAVTRYFLYVVLQNDMIQGILAGPALNFPILPRQEKRSFMKIFTIKMILARSNPQVIRELQMEDSRTIFELQDMAKTFFLDDPKTCTSAAFYLDDQSLSPKLTLSKILKSGSFAQIVLNLKNLPKKQIYLEVLEISEAADFSAPRITRFRPDCVNTALAYYPSEAVNRYEERLARMNRDLKRLFCPDALIPEFCKDIAISLDQILEAYTVSALKEMADRFNLFYANGTRKAVLIDTLCEEMNTDDYWKQVLSCLDHSEYQAMRSLCINGYLPDPSKNCLDVCPELTARGLVARDNAGVVRIAKEFMNFYEHWMENNNEQQFLLKLCYRTVLKAASRLYGFVDRKLAEELMLHCYPDICKNMDLAPIWVSETVALIPAFRLLNATAYYDSTRFRLEDVEYLFSDFIMRNRLHYVPDQDMLEYVAVRGYRLDEPVETAYRALLTKYHYTHYQIRYSVDEFATLTYYQYTKGQILARCRSTLRLLDNSPLLTSISNFLKAHENEFRQLPLAGFTQAEMKSQMKSSRPAAKKKTVYPNDPCPCGSGKKYKLCCGRK